MMEQIEQNNNKVYKFIIILGDLVILNVLFILLYNMMDVVSAGTRFAGVLLRLSIISNLVYLVCNYSHGVVLHRRIVRADHIVQKAIRNTVLHALVFNAFIAFLTDFGHLPTRFLILFYSLFLICLISYRLGARFMVKAYRRHGGNSRAVVMIGEGESMSELYLELTSDSSSGFNVLGYFADAPSRFYPEQLPHLGKLKSAIPYLQENKAQDVYCGLDSIQSEVIVPLINYCENHFIRFFYVPDVRHFLKRQMHFEMIGSTPVMSIRQEPLARLENRILKRAFDVLFSLTFLCTLFPFLYIGIAIAIKCSSPGPIFFKQKRSGKEGKEFWCYKFRSMRVNDQSDTLQATKNDCRKTRVGDFLRRSNLDELPQFINVLRGDMSVVGPRPHMLKHTEEYSKLIDKYMVRHLVKPGITGWAQINGFRGETKELWQMEGRVVKDIWYLEHWTFLLDIYIIYRTVKNCIMGDEEAY